MTTSQKQDGLWQGQSPKERKNMEIWDTNGKWQEETVWDCKWAQWEKKWNMHWNETTELWDYALRTLSIAMLSPSWQSRTRFITHPPGLPHSALIEASKATATTKINQLCLFASPWLLWSVRKCKAHFPSVAVSSQSGDRLENPGEKISFWVFLLSIGADVPFKVLMDSLLFRVSYIYL